MGYLAACSLQYVHLAYETFFMSNLVILAIGAFLFALTTIRDLKGVLNSINALSAKCKTEKDRLEVMTQIREFVQMHSALKELSFLSMRSRAPSLFFYLLNLIGQLTCSRAFLSRSLWCHFRGAL